MNKNFIVTQILVLILAFGITGLMQLASEQAIYLFYCLPFLIVWMSLEYFVLKIDNFGVFIGFNVILFVTSCPLFFGLYFGIFNPTQSIELNKVSNCQVIGKQSVNLSGTENYSILYVDYEQNGQKYLGYACQSDRYDAGTNNFMLPYIFYENGDKFLCGPTKKGDSYDLTKKRVLERERQLRLLRGRSGGRSGGRSSRTSSSSGSSCSQKYTFSNVKLASWMCLPRDISPDQLMQLHDHCYSLENSINRNPLRTASQFMMVSYDPVIYYPKVDFIMMILFTYIPFLITFTFPMHFLARYLVDKISISTVKVTFIGQDILDKMQEQSKQLDMNAEIQLGEQHQMADKEQVKFTNQNQENSQTEIKQENQQKQYPIQAPNL